MHLDTNMLLSHRTITTRNYHQSGLFLLCRWPQTLTEEREKSLASVIMCVSILNNVEFSGEDAVSPFDDIWVSVRGAALAGSAPPRRSW